MTLTPSAVSGHLWLHWDKGRGEVKDGGRSGCFQGASLFIMCFQHVPSFAAAPGDPQGPRPGSPGPEHRSYFYLRAGRAAVAGRAEVQLFPRRIGY